MLLQSQENKCRKMVDATALCSNDTHERKEKEPHNGRPALVFRTLVY